MRAKAGSPTAGRIEARQRTVGRRPRGIPGEIPRSGAPWHALAHACRREQIPGIDATLAEQKVRRRRRAARRADDRRKDRRVRAFALGHARGLDLGAKANAGQIGIVLDGTANGFVQRQLQRGRLSRRLGCGRRRSHQHCKHKNQRIHRPVSITGAATDTSAGSCSSARCVRARNM